MTAINFDWVRITAATANSKVVGDRCIALTGTTGGNVKVLKGTVAEEGEREDVAQI